MQDDEQSKIVAEDSKMMHKHIEHFVSELYKLEATASKQNCFDPRRRTKTFESRASKHLHHRRDINTHLILNMLIIIALAQPIVGWIVDFNNPVVHTQYGSIRGKIDERKTKFNRRPICTFLSIPYARPPVGSNRFLPPVEPDAWQNLDAFSKRVMCPQVEQRFRIFISASDPIIESEDCLYLNVFVPVDRATPVINYPVIVYIHGGEFRHGSKDHYSPEYLLDHGLILVTINYRLGVLGFLSTDDMAAPGNLGLYDQIAALRWVKRNIQSFGGNNDDITLLGHDAGAISASLLLLAPHETQGLINKVIAVGGSAFSPAALHWNPRRQSREFARELRCMDERSDKIIRCLRLKDWRLLVAASRLSHNFELNTFRYWFRPVIDRNSTYSLIRDYPAQLYASGAFLRVPLMSGVSAHEGSLEFFINWHQLRPLSSLERIRFLIRPYLYEFSRSEIVATTLDYNYVKRYNSSGYALAGGSHFHHNGQQVNSLNTPVVLANRLTASGQFWHEQNIGLERNEYDVYISPNDQRSKEIARQIDAIGDFLHVAPAIRQLELHSLSVAQTYMFVFDYKGSRSFGHIQLNPYGRSLNIDGEAQTNGWLPSVPTSSGAILSSETSNFGVTHNDDLFYLLPNDFEPLSSTGGAMQHHSTSSGSASGSLGSGVGGGGVGGGGSNNADTPNDDNAVRNYVTYLAAFASRIGDQATSAGAANNLANWLPFRTTDRNYIRFSEQLPTLYKNFHQIDVAFVNELVEPIEELVNTPLPLFPYEELRDFKVSTAALGIMLLLIVLTLIIITLLIACRRKRRRRRREDSSRSFAMQQQQQQLQQQQGNEHNDPQLQQQQQQHQFERQRADIGSSPAPMMMMKQQQQQQSELQRRQLKSNLGEQVGFKKQVALASSSQPIEPQRAPILATSGGGGNNNNNYNYNNSNVRRTVQKFNSGAINGAGGGGGGGGFNSAASLDERDATTAAVAATIEQLEGRMSRLSQRIANTYT